MSNDKVINLEQEVNKRTIFRKAHNQENPYAQISKRILRDSRLSAKAMGLMCYFLSLPDNWEISITELIKHFSDGEKSIRAGIKELMLVGYIETYQSRYKNGCFSSTIFLVHEEPAGKERSLEPREFYPYAQNRHAGYRHAENGALLNTEDTEYRITNNNKEVISNTDKLETQLDDSVVVALMERLKHLAISRVLVASWLKKHSAEYIIEKIDLTESQKPRSPECFLNKAIAQDWRLAFPRQPKNEQENPSEPTYPSHEENVVWYNSLVNEDKLKHLQMALFKHSMFEAHLKHQQTSVLDATFSSHGLFKMFMSILGRAE